MGRHKILYLMPGDTIEIRTGGDGSSVGWRDASFRDRFHLRLRGHGSIETCSPSTSVYSCDGKLLLPQKEV